MQYELRQAYYDTEFNRTLSEPILSGTKEKCWQQAFKRNWVFPEVGSFWWDADDARNFHNSYCTIERVTP